MRPFLFNFVVHQMIRKRNSFIALFLLSCSLGWSQRIDNLKGLISPKPFFPEQFRKGIITNNPLPLAPPNPNANQNYFCDTLRNITNLQSIAIYWADSVAPHDSGYMTGTNIFHDKAKAERYYYTNVNQQLFAFRAYLHVAGTGTVNFNVWSATTSTVTAGFVPDAVIATSQVGLGTLSQGWNTINLPSPITPPTMFFIGFEIPTSQGDTIAVATNNYLTGGGISNSGFEEWSNSQWINYSDPRDFNLILSNYLFPILCELSNVDSHSVPSQLKIAPNPSDGVFSLQIPGGNTNTLEIAVSDMMGNILTSFLVSSSEDGNIPMDLRKLLPGIYFLKVSTPNICDRFTRIIIK